MRIVNSVLGDATGGRWKVVCDYTRVLKQAGHSVHLLLDRRHLPDLDRLPAEVETTFIRNRGHYDYLAAWQVARLLRWLLPDVAIAHCSRSVALLKRALRGRAPLMAVSHSNKVRRLLVADSCIALTEYIRRCMEQRLSDQENKQIFVIPNMIDIDRSTPLLPRRRGEPPCIAAMGRFDTVKGFDVFLDALAILRQRGMAFRALLAGQGPQAPALQNQVAMLGLQNRIRFPGWIEDTASFLAEIDMLCVPARSDAFGLTPLEAASAGVPLVLSKATGHIEMFDDTQVRFADTGDAEATADRLQELLESEQLWNRLREAAFRHVKKSYSEPLVVEKILHAIDLTIFEYNKKSIQ
jgi:glycosyltransferase involved in cell wall biosynthesis